MARRLGAPARFVALGTMSFSLNLGITAALHEVFGVSPEIAFAVALATVFGTNFAAMRWWVFPGGARRWLPQLLAFGASSLFFRGGEYVGYLLLYRLAGLPYLGAAVVVISVSFGLKYAVYGGWLFGDGDTPPLASAPATAFRALARRRGLAVLLTGVATLLLDAAITAVRVPAPALHDEFSYLLAADTYRSGRLANPTHPLWQHFETFHVLQQPSYASKYPPAQGLVLALGEVIGGHAIVGVWIAGALAAAACCWMLQGWVPARFALLGAVLIVFHHCLRFYWHDYWNGSLPLAGGALLLGALPRLRRRADARAALALGTGLVILANSRPFAGLVLSLPVAASLLARWLGPRRRELARFATRVVAPVVALLALGAAGMAYNNARVTGDPWTLPYQAHSDQYLYTPSFLWQKPRPQPAYRHAVMRDFYLGWQAEGYRAQQSLLEAFRRKRENVYFFLTPLLLCPLLTLPWMLRSPKNRFALATALLCFGASLSVAGTHAHYIAPVAPLLFLLVVQGLRQVAQWRPRGRRVGPRVVAAFAAAQVLIFVAAFAAYAARPPHDWSVERERIRKQLEATPGRHLVMACYAPDHSPHEEWVWNAADIDGAKVVWARSLGRERDRALRDYFADRRVWTLYADREPPAVVEGGPCPDPEAG